jgi:hypothetical protein
VGARGGGMHYLNPICHLLHFLQNKTKQNYHVNVKPKGFEKKINNKKITKAKN